MNKKKLNPEFMPEFGNPPATANELQGIVASKAQEAATVKDEQGYGVNATKFNGFFDGANFAISELIVKGLLNDFNCTNVKTLYFAELRKEWVIEYIDGTYNEFESIIDVVDFLVTDGE